MIQLADEGSGPALVLLHGFCETNFLWSGLLKDLSKTHRVLAPDLPGHGRSTLPNELHSLVDVARSLLAALEESGVSEFTVIGHSLGGYVALAMLEISPERVKGLGLFHSTALADGPEKKENRTRAMRFIELHGDEAFKKNFIPSLYHSAHGWLGDLRDMIMPTPMTTILTYTRLMRERPDRIELLANTGIPVLLIAGAYDEFIPTKSLEKQAEEIPTSSFHKLKDSGHLGMWEEPEAARVLVRNWLAETGL